MACYQCEAADLLTPLGNIAADPEGENTLQESEAACLYQYSVIEIQHVFSPQTSYGILGKHLINGNWIIAAAAAPLSSDLESVTKLAEQCTALQLYPEHLIDVASDFICQAPLDT